MSTTVELKSKHEQVIELVNEISNTVRNLGVAFATIEDAGLDGRHITLEGKTLINFGSCSYLGLEVDPRMKQGVVDAVQKYGTQFSSSRAYLSVTLYKEAERLLSQIFGQPAIMAPTVMLGHIAAIPVLIGDHDAVILDAQVHESVQTTVQMLKVRNVHVELIRHNRMDMLESRISKLSESFEKVWYFADGVYSMYGDFAPMAKLVELMDKNEKFHLYIDDAHGMSWAGKHGAGYVMSQLTSFPQKMYLVTSANKAFGAGGGILVFPNEAECQKVRNCGKTYIFAGPIQPPMLGAVIASAKIHLSDEITELQDELMKRIKFFNETAKLYKLPLVDEGMSPIRFIGVGKPTVGYNMVRRMMNLGFYFNLSVYPSVPYKNTGLRIPINRNHTFEDIENLLASLADQLPKSLEESGSNFEEIYKAFKMNIPS